MFELFYIVLLVFPRLVVICDLTLFIERRLFILLEDAYNMEKAKRCMPNVNLVITTNPNEILSSAILILQAIFTACLSLCLCMRIVLLNILEGRIYLEEKYGSRPRTPKVVVLYINYCIMVIK